MNSWIGSGSARPEVTSGPGAVCLNTVESTPEPKLKTAPVATLRSTLARSTRLHGPVFRRSSSDGCRTESASAASSWPSIRAGWIVGLDRSGSTSSPLGGKTSHSMTLAVVPPVSLAAYLSGQSQSDAARALADMLGLKQ